MGSRRSKVYLDTNVFDSYFRSNPDAYIRCRSAKKRGILFVGSVEVVQELANNREDLAEAKRSYRRFLEIVSPHLLSQPRAELIKRELSTLAPLAHEFAFFPPQFARERLDDIWKDFESDDLDKACRTFCAESKEYFKNGREEWREIAKRVPIDPALSFDQFWLRFVQMETFADVVKEVADQAGSPVPDMAECRARLDSIRTFKTAMVVTAAQIYANLNPECKIKPHKNDKMDAGHAIVASQADIFVTADGPFLKVLKLAEGALPYKPISADEFITSLGDGDAVSYPG